MKINWGFLIPKSLGGPHLNIYHLLFGGDISDTDVFFVNHRLLWDWILSNGPQTILEVGLGNGINALVILALVRNESEYYCFDTLSTFESKRAYDLLKDRVNFFVGDSRETLPKTVSKLPPMDMIFIDGGHDYDVVQSDWENCRQLMHPHTACFFHDYSCSGVKRAVDEIGDGFSVEIVKPKLGTHFALVRKASILEVCG